MVQDRQTNIVYLAEGLMFYHPLVTELIGKFYTEDVEFHWLPRTKKQENIWVRDYMPIQLEKDLFLQYRYDPDYLKGYPAYMPDYRTICKDLGLQCILTDIILDGGNVIKCADKVIMTDKIFKENPGYQKKDLVDTLEGLFRAELVIIPWDRYEMFGHADGMVRYIDGNRVLLNNYVNFDPGLRKRLFDALSPHFDVVELNYKAVRPSKMSWVFLNYLQVGDCLFVPWLPIWENKAAEAQLQEVFDGYRIHMVGGIEEVAYEGGALNCVSWNILGDKQKKSQEEA